MKKIGKNKGITLITLVITVVVTLIIAGIVLATLTGDSGFIKQMQNSKMDTEISDITEAIDLIMTGWYKTGEIGTVKFENYLDSKEAGEEIDDWTRNDDGSYDIEINGYVGTVTEEDGLRGEVQKKGVRPEVTGYTITNANGEEVEQYSQIEGTPLYVKITAKMDGGYIESYSPSQTVEVLKNGTCTFIITGVADDEKSSITYGVEVDKYILPSAPKGISFASTSGSMDLSLQTTMQLEPIIEPSTANRETGITWTSSDESVAIVDNTGFITGKSNGTAVIKAETENGRIAEYTLLCYTTPTRISLSQTTGIIDLSSGVKTIQLEATIEPSTANVDTEIIWTSSDESVATVNSGGLVTGVANGNTTITVKTTNGKTATCAITVQTSPTGITLNKTSTTIDLSGTKTVQLSVTYTPTTANVSTGLTWTSSNTSVATVSSSGLVTAVANGSATITATTANGKTATCTVTCVTSITSITVSPTSATMKTGEIKQLTATVEPSTTTEKVTWTSSNESVATVDSNGLVTAKTNGTVTITVKNPDGTITATCTITVNVAPVITSVSLKSKTTSSITINAKATDADGDKLTYTLYTVTSSDNLTLQTSSAETAQGTQISIAQSSLSQYTTYYYQIEVTDGIDTVKGDIKSVRTYCPGNTYRCTDGYSTTIKVTCSKCSGTGTIACTIGSKQNFKDVFNGVIWTASCTCSLCGASFSYWSWPVGPELIALNSAFNNASNHNQITCTSCSGKKYTTTTSPHRCSHGYTSSHYYCEHGYTSQHD